MGAATMGISQDGVTLWVWWPRGSLGGLVMPMTMLGRGGGTGLVCFVAGLFCVAPPRVCGSVAPSSVCFLSHQGFMAHRLFVTY